MGWKDLLQEEGESVVLPWTGGRRLSLGTRSWTLDGRLPAEHGWWRFRISGRRASLDGEAEPDESVLGHRVKGYLVGDRVVPDGTTPDPDPSRILGSSEQVLLLERGLDRFARICAGRASEDGPLVHVGPDFPLGPEDDVLRAYQDGKEDLSGIKGVHPALDAAFRLESWHRRETEARRAELERLRREEEARRALEERRRELRERLGDGAARRAMARVDFAEAARAALAVGGAEYLDHRPCRARGEMAVTFRLDGRRFECTCDERTLRIIDSGICLVDHRTGVRGDELFTLESLPSVIREAARTRVLHVFRHVDDPELDEEDDPDW